MSRSYRVVAVATAVFAALLTASAFLWLSARANASETKVEAEPAEEVRVVALDGDDDGEPRVVVVRADGGGANVVVGDSDDPVKTRVVVVNKTGDGAGAFMGVQLSEETKYKDGGARVDEVVSDSPAEKAGLKEGDIIVGFNGQPIHGPMRLSESIHAAKPGDRVDLDVVRGGSRQKITVEMGERPKSFAYWYGDEGKGFTPLPEGKFHDLEGFKELKDMPGMFQWRMFGSRPKLGIRIVDTTPDLREHLGGPRDAGILVGKVMTGTPAEKAGLKVGDILVSVDGEQVTGVGSLIEALDDKDGKTVDLEVIRDRKTIRLKATLPESKDMDDDPGPQAYYFSTPAPPAPPAAPTPPSPRALSAPPAPPAAPAPPAPPAPRDWVDARSLALQDLVAAQLRAEIETARAVTPTAEELKQKVDAELRAVAASVRDSAQARAELERELSRNVAGALEGTREAAEQLREELRQAALEGLEVY